jgi:sugar (pentulose or hexulose) kinase
MVLIFDIGKTNKKAFIFDENYRNYPADHKRKQSNVK